MTGEELTPEELDAQIAEATQALERAHADAQAVLAGGEGTSTELVPAAATAEAARAQLAQQRARAMRMREEVAVQAERLRELQRAKVGAMERQMRRELSRMQDVLGPLQDQLKRIEEAVWTVNLYLGRDEEILRLHNGNPAPADTPVVVRQLVLAMDQECAVAAEAGGIDSLDHEKFDAWLQEDWAHVEQVIPERKAVVAVVPRWDMKFYEDEATTIAAAQGNGQTYFLVRNGEQLFRTWTDFRIGKTLVPTRDEFTGYFMRATSSSERREDPTVPDQVAMEPGSEAWAKAEEAASYRQRQYMRVALILEGLLHRTTVFHPLPEGGISFTDPRYHDEGKVRFVLDAERTLGTGMEPFDAWLQRLNAQLRKGMRVVGSFQSQGWYAANHAEHEETGRRGGRVRGAGGGEPQTGWIYTIEDRDRNGDLIIRFNAEGERWVEDGETPYPDKPGYVYKYKRRPYARRKSAILRPDDDFIIPYDLVTPEECQSYLDSRLERHEYVTMFPVLKAVIRAKAMEEAEEQPFRQMLAGVLARETGQATPVADDEVRELVRWFKLANRIHRPLVGEDEAKAVRLVTAEYKRRRRDAERGHSGERVAGLLAKHPDAMLVARKRSGPYVVLVPEGKGSVWARELEYNARGDEPRSDKRWTLPGTRPSRWVILHSTERWEGWNVAAVAADYLTDPEREQLLDSLRRRPVREGERLAAVTTRVGHDDDYDYDRRGHLFAERWVFGKSYHGEPQLAAYQMRWQRQSNGVVSVHQSGSSSAYSWSERRGDVPWKSDVHGRKRTVVWADPDVLEAFHVAHEDYREERTESQQRAKLVRRAVAAAEQAWLAPRYAKVWQRFLEDYGDPGVWEGHLKAHRDVLPQFPYAHGAFNRSPLWQLSLSKLVAAGREPWGMTVRQVMDGFPPSEAEVEAVWHDDRELPDDLADLVFTEGFKAPEPWVEALRRGERECPMCHETKARTAFPDDDEGSVCFVCVEQIEETELVEPDWDAEADAELEGLPEVS